MSYHHKRNTLRDCEDTKQEFTYPMWFKSKENGKIVKFTDITVGVVVEQGDGSDSVGTKSFDWISHTWTETWEQVENPFIDKAIETVINEEYQKPIQYRNGIDTFQRARANMSKDKVIACIQFNIDKYNWREKNQDIEDFEKIIDYAKFAIKVLKDN